MVVQDCCCDSDVVMRRQNFGLDLPIFWKGLFCLCFERSLFLKGLFCLFFERLFCLLFLKGLCLFVERSVLFTFFDRCFVGQYFYFILIIRL